MGRKEFTEVQRLLLALEPGGVNIPDLMAALKLKDVQRFTENYIQPALEQKLIKKVTQKEATDGMDYYKLTRKGRGLREGIER